MLYVFEALPFQMLWVYEGAAMAVPPRATSRPPWADPWIMRVPLPLPLPTARGKRRRGRAVLRPGPFGGRVCDSLSQPTWALVLVRGWVGGRGPPPCPRLTVQNELGPGFT